MRALNRSYNIKAILTSLPSPRCQKLAKIDKRVLSGERTREEVQLTFPDGNKYTFWEVKTPIFCDTEPNKVIGILGISTDITERKQLEEQLLYDASTDPLTELLNRRYFYVSFITCVTSKQTRSKLWRSNIYRLNKFKKLNDQYGHNTGDVLSV